MFSRNSFLLCPRNLSFVTTNEEFVEYHSRGAPLSHPATSTIGDIVMISGGSMFSTVAPCISNIFDISR